MTYHLTSLDVHVALKMTVLENNQLHFLAARVSQLPSGHPIKKATSQVIGVMLKELQSRGCQDTFGPDPGTPLNDTTALIALATRMGLAHEFEQRMIAALKLIIPDDGAVAGPPDFWPLPRR